MGMKRSFKFDFISILLGGLFINISMALGVEGGNISRPPANPNSNCYTTVNGVQCTDGGTLSRVSCEANCQAPNYCRIRSISEANVYICAPPAQDDPPEEAATGDGSCTPEYHRLLQACRDSVEETRNSCDEKQDQGMNSVNNSASQVALMMGQQGASSIQAACSKMAGLTQAANAALAAYQLNCSNSISNCNAACTQAKNFAQRNASCLTTAGTQNPTMHVEALVATAEEDLRKCEGFRANVAQANQAIQNYIGTSANASQCAALNDGTGALPAICQSNPSFPGCSAANPVDCTKPEFATTNKVCICSKNPNDPSCATALKAGGSVLGASASGIDSSTRMGDRAGATGGFGEGDIPNTPGIEHGTADRSASSAVDGQQGNGSPLSGSGSGGGGAGGGGRGGSGNQADPAAQGSGGFYGGSGGRFGGGGSGGGSEGYRGYGVAPDGKPFGGNPMGPDLRKFLPGGQFDPKRGLSGVSGPDGITGPNSNIWQKIQNRYQVMGPTLLP